MFALSTRTLGAFAVSVGFLLTLMAVPVARAEQQSPTASSPRPLEADREQLGQVMLERRIDSTLSRPGLSLYTRDAALAFGRWTADWLELLLPRFARLAGSWTEPLLKLLLALLALILLGYLLHFTVRRWQLRQPARPEPIRGLAATDDQPDRQAPRWEEELRQRLERGEVTAAVEALWWWLARRLVGSAAEPSWTSRELVTKAGRRDLMPGVRRLDHMIYGSGRPSADQVSRLWRDLREAVG